MPAAPAAAVFMKPLRESVFFDIIILPFSCAPDDVIWFSLSLADDLHRLRIPAIRPAVEVAHIRQQRRPSCAEAKDRVFNHRLAGAHRLEEICEVIEVIAVAPWSEELLFARRADLVF